MPNGDNLLLIFVLLRSQHIHLAVSRIYRSAITSIPSLSISLSRKGLRCWCFRIISTGQPRRASRYAFRRTIRKNLGGISTQISTSLPSWCWFLAFSCFHSKYPFLKGFCPYRAQGGLRLYPGCYPGLGASAPSGRVGGSDQSSTDLRILI